MTLTQGVLLGSAIKFLTYLKPQAVSPCCSCNLCPRNMLQCTVRAHLQVIELSANDLIPAGDRIRKIKCAVRWAVARTNASLNQNLPVFAGEKNAEGVHLEFAIYHCYLSILPFPTSQSHCSLRTCLTYRQFYSQLLQVGSSCSKREGEHKQT